jgi:hypothetical protein
MEKIITLGVKWNYRQFAADYIAETLTIVHATEPIFALRLAKKIFADPTDEQVLDIVMQRCKLQSHGPLMLLKYPDTV